MKLPTVFIASSSEGLEVAKAIRTLLLQEFRDTVRALPWTRVFELSATYIESLEKASQEADFAIMVLTPDDIIISRQKQMDAPRDNVLFELGLFMGCLGRERCFIVSEESSELKLPSDFLGIHLAKFCCLNSVDLKDALDFSCNEIARRITELGARHKFSKDSLNAQAAIRRFCDSIEGAWWERTSLEDSIGLSYFVIAMDDLHNSLTLNGKAYNQEGCHIANWKSEISRVNLNDNKIIYHWKGWHTLPHIANVPFHGFGEMEFDKPLRDGIVIRGGGKYWEVDEFHPENTIIKPVELRRIQDEKNVTNTIFKGLDAAEVKSLITKTLREW
jgi:hypothetical protein